MTDHVEKRRRISALDELRAEFVRLARAESPSPSSRRLWRLGVVLAGLVLVAIGAAAAGIVLTSDADPVATPQEPPAGFAASGPLYESLPQLAAKTDLVIVGTVEDVLPPRVIEAEDPEYPTRDLDTVVRVDEVFKGSAPSGVVTVTTYELAFGWPGSVEWRESGKRVLLFLSPSRETSGLHILANTNSSQTAYVIDGGDIRATVADSLGQRVAALSLPEIREAVRAAP